MIQLPLSVVGEVVLPHFLTSSAGALVVAVVASAVRGFIVWWAVALAVCFLALALWRLRRRLGTGTWMIWVVRQGHNLYVRSVYGRSSTWFRGTQDRHEGHIEAGGVDKDVLFVDTNELNDEIDAAYRTKYRRYPAEYVDPMAGPEARAATIKLVPR